MLFLKVWFVKKVITYLNTNVAHSQFINWMSTFNRKKCKWVQGACHSSSTPWFSTHFWILMFGKFIKASWGVRIFLLTNTIGMYECLWTFWLHLRLWRDTATMRLYRLLFANLKLFPPIVKKWPSQELQALFWVTLLNYLDSETCKTATFLFLLKIQFAVRSKTYIWVYFFACEGLLLMGELQSAFVAADVPDPHASSLVRKLINSLPVSFGMTIQSTGSSNNGIPAAAGCK